MDLLATSKKMSQLSDQKPRMTDQVCVRTFYELGPSGHTGRQGCDWTEEASFTDEDLLISAGQSSGLEVREHENVLIVTTLRPRDCEVDL